MDTALLKHLGVHERIVQALEKSSNGKFEELEIEQGNACLRLILRYRHSTGLKTHIITLNDLLDTGPSCLTAAEPQASYAAGAPETYRCQDRLLFLAHQTETGGSNLSLNGQKLKLSDSLFRLLHHLAGAMKKTGEGWVSIQDLRSARLIPPDGYQPFSRLRSVLAGYLLKKNPRDFLESNGCKEYRLSVPSRNIILLPETDRAP